MRFYVYVSDAKLDMLFPQIPGRLRDHIAAELRLDLKVVSVSLSSAPDESTRYSKLALVERYLEREGLVGTLDEPAAFVRGELPMRWGPIGLHGDSSTIFFSHASPAVGVVGLGGSQRHVIGQEGAADMGPYSALFGLLPAIERGAAEDASPGAAAEPPAHDDDSTTFALSCMAVMAKGRSGPEQQLEFLARPLLAGEAYGAPALLASPLYVAYADGA